MPLISVNIGGVQSATLISLFERSESFRCHPGKEGKGTHMGWVVLGTLLMGSKGEKNIFQLPDSCSSKSCHLQLPCVTYPFLTYPCVTYPTTERLTSWFTIYLDCAISGCPLPLGTRRASEPLGLWLQKTSSTAGAETCTRSSRAALTPEPSHLPPLRTLTPISL